MKTPELKKYVDLLHDRTLLQQFLTWLPQQNLAVVAEANEGDYESQWKENPLPDETLIAAYFGIDLEKVEEETQAIIREHLRTMTNE